MLLHGAEEEAGLHALAAAEKELIKIQIAGLPSVFSDLDKFGGEHDDVGFFFVD